ncbi:hypothetical protein ACPXA0_25925, partial [Escherichia coli]|uniref:hypothetical protein n=1 Tax=Escherichia coli TaxID=562 RepID=UPI003CE51399
MFRDYLKALPIAALLTLFVVTVSYVIHRNDSSRNSVGSAQIYIDDQGMEVAGDRAVVIARSGSTVILYKGASLIDSKLDSLST